MSIQISQPSSTYSHGAPTALTTGSKDDDQSVYTAVFGSEPPSVTLGPMLPREPALWCLTDAELLEILAADPHKKVFIDDISGQGKKKVNKKQFFEVMVAACEKKKQEAMQKHFEGFKETAPPWGHADNLENWLYERGVPVLPVHD